MSVSRTTNSSRGGTGAIGSLGRTPILSICTLPVLSAVPWPSAASPTASGFSTTTAADGSPRPAATPDSDQDQDDRDIDHAFEDVLKTVLVVSTDQAGRLRSSSFPQGDARTPKSAGTTTGGSPQFFRGMRHPFRRSVISRPSRRGGDAMDVDGVGVSGGFRGSMGRPRRKIAPVGYDSLRRASGASTASASSAASSSRRTSSGQGGGFGSLSMTISPAPTATAAFLMQMNQDAEVPTHAASMSVSGGFSIRPDCVETPLPPPVPQGSRQGQDGDSDTDDDDAKMDVDSGSASESSKKKLRRRKQRRKQRQRQRHRSRKDFKKRNMGWCVVPFQHPAHTDPCCVLVRGKSVLFRPFGVLGNQEQQDTKLPLPEAIGHRCGVYAVCQVSPLHVVTAARDGEISVFKIPITMTMTMPIPTPAVDRRITMSSPPSAAAAVVSKSDTTCRLVSVFQVSEKEDAPSELRRVVRGFGNGSADDLLLSVCGSVVLWNWRSGERIFTYSPGSRPCMHLAVARPLEEVLAADVVHSPTLDGYRAAIAWAALEGGGIHVLAVFPHRIFLIREYSASDFPEVSSLRSSRSSRYVVACRTSDGAVLVYDASALDYTPGLPLHLVQTLRAPRGLKCFDATFCIRRTNDEEASVSVVVVAGTQTGETVGWLLQPSDRPPINQLDPRAVTLEGCGVEERSSLRRFLGHCEGRVRWTTSTSMSVSGGSHLMEARVSMIVLANALKKDLAIEESSGEIVVLSKKNYNVRPDVIEALLAGRAWDPQSLLLRIRPVVVTDLLEYWLFFNELGLLAEAAILANLVSFFPLSQVLILLHAVLQSFPNVFVDHKPLPSIVATIVTSLKIQLPRIEQDQSLLMQLDMRTFAYLKHERDKPTPAIARSSATFEELFLRRIRECKSKGVATNGTFVSFNARASIPIHKEIVTMFSRIRMGPEGSDVFEMPLDERALPLLVEFLYFGSIPKTASLKIYFDLMRNGSFLLPAQRQHLLFCLAEKIRSTERDLLAADILEHGYLTDPDDPALTGLFVSLSSLSRVQVVKLMQKSRSIHELEQFRRRLEAQESANLRLTSQVEALQEEVGELKRLRMAKDVDGDVPMLPIDPDEPSLNVPVPIPIPVDDLQQQEQEGGDEGAEEQDVKMVDDVREDEEDDDEIGSEKRKKSKSPSPPLPAAPPPPPPAAAAEVVTVDIVTPAFIMPMSKSKSASPSPSRKRKRDQMESLSGPPELPILRKRQEGEEEEEFGVFGEQEEQEEDPGDKVGVVEMPTSTSSLGAKEGVPPLPKRRKLSPIPPDAAAAPAPGPTLPVPIPVPVPVPFVAPVAEEDEPVLVPPRPPSRRRRRVSSVRRTRQSGRVEGDSSSSEEDDDDEYVDEGGDEDKDDEDLTF